MSAIIMNINIHTLKIICVRFVPFIACKLYLRVLLEWRKSLWLKQSVNLEGKMNKVSKLNSAVYEKDSNSVMPVNWLSRLGSGNHLH